MMVEVSIDIERNGDWVVLMMTVIDGGVAGAEVQTEAGILGIVVIEEIGAEA